MLKALGALGFDGRDHKAIQRATLRHCAAPGVVRYGSRVRRRPPICAYLRPFSPISLTLLVADCRSVGSLVVPAMPAQRIPDVPAAAGGCTESGVNGVGMPGDGPPTSCPAPAAAACRALAR